ncbi:MAG: sugar phosphate isomerase/epimerase [Sediminibacterium sp.]|jgi:sugar phosphate isomerase/epimerase|nr:sugar phosphate isomerase/epimerase [Sediminibacterium sp.]
MSNSRRSFLCNTALASLALGTPFNKELFAMVQKKNKFGIQLWTVKEALAKDPLGVLKYLSNCGYKQIESFEGAKGIFWGMKNTEFKKQLGDMEMNMIASHCDINKDFERKTAEAGEIGMKYLICPHIGAQKSIDDYKRFADQFNKCGEIANKNGIRFAYHNHDYSFKAMAGGMPQDVMMNATDANLVDFEMDIYWVVAAGADPIAYLKKYPNRFKLCHVKDLIKTPSGHESCILGKGTIDFKNILYVGAQNGLKFHIIEQEAYTGTTELDCAKENAIVLNNLDWRA